MLLREKAREKNRIVATSGVVTMMWYCVVNSSRSGIMHAFEKFGATRRETGEEKG
jgi:hypothetical protein